MDTDPEVRLHPVRITLLRFLLRLADPPGEGHGVAHICPGLQVSRQRQLRLRLLAQAHPQVATALSAWRENRAAMALATTAAAARAPGSRVRTKLIASSCTSGSALSVSPTWKRIWSFFWWRGQPDCTSRSCALPPKTAQMIAVTAVALLPASRMAFASKSMRSTVSSAPAKTTGDSGSSKKVVPSGDRLTVISMAPAVLRTAVVDDAPGRRAHAAAPPEIWNSSVPSSYQMITVLKRARVPVSWFVMRRT